MIEVCSLSSGSKGNCFFIKTGNDAFLVDAGISSRQICRRLETIGHHISEIKGIFITHEHTDHICGIEVLLKRHQIPVYINWRTLQYSTVKIPDPLIRYLNANERVMVGDALVETRRKRHDAADPCLFSFYFRGNKISVITDLGIPCENVVHAIRHSNILFIETNHDESMLKNGPYPYYLKQRILSEEGHLSNSQAGILVRDNASPNLEYVFLSHISETNNTPRLALETFTSFMKENPAIKEARTIVTDRFTVSEVIKISIGEKE